ncbi:MAG: hypothetical protein ACQ5SW_04175 [Sphaerochaetaceae bacterium]
MKRLLLACMFLLLLVPLAAEEAPRFPSATVYMLGVIEPRDLEIAIYNEEGEELSGDEALLRFEFPSLETWEVTQSLYFRYSSHLSKATVGKLTFSISDLEKDEANRLRTTLELKSENLSTSVENGDTFTTTFPAGAQNDVDIGKLTLKIIKRSEDVFSAGSYSGSFSINYTEES